MKSTALVFAVGIAATTLFACPQSAKARSNVKGSISVAGKSKSEFSALAKVSLQDAIGIATKSVSGRVTEAGLDRSNGYLVYEIELKRNDKSSAELIVDAGDGKVLSSTTEEGDDEDQNEKD